MSFSITISPLAAYAKLASTSDYCHHGTSEEVCRQWLARSHALFRRGGGGSHGLVVLGRLDQAGNWMLLRVGQEPAPDSFGRAHEAAVGGPVGVLDDVTAVALLISAFRSQTPERNSWRHGAETVVELTESLVSSPSAAVTDAALSLALGLVPWVQCADAASALACVEAVRLSSLDWLLVGSISTEAIPALPSGYGIIITPTQFPAPKLPDGLALLSSQARKDLLALEGLTHRQRLKLAEMAVGLHPVEKADDPSLQWLFHHGGATARPAVLNLMSGAAVDDLLLRQALADEEVVQLLPVLPKSDTVAAKLATLGRRDLFDHHFGNNHPAVEAFLSPAAWRWWQYLSANPLPDCSETPNLDDATSALEELDQNAMTDRLPIFVLGRMRFSRVLQSAFCRRLVREGLLQPVAEALVFGTPMQEPPAAPAQPFPSKDWVSELRPGHLASFGAMARDPAWLEWWLEAITMNRHLVTQLGAHPDPTSLQGDWCVTRGWACSQVERTQSEGALLFTLRALQWRHQAMLEDHPLLGRMIKNAGLNEDILARALKHADNAVRAELSEALCWLVANAGIDLPTLLTLVPEAASALNTSVADEHWRGILSLDGPAVETVPEADLEKNAIPLLQVLAGSPLWWERWSGGVPAAWLSKLQGLLQGSSAEVRLQCLLRASKGELLTSQELFLSAPALPCHVLASQVARRAGNPTEDSRRCIILALESPAMALQPELHAWLSQRCFHWQEPSVDLPCGTPPALMKALLPLLEPRETANWLRSNASSSVLADDQETLSTLKLLVKKGCPTFHSPLAHD